MVVSFVCGSSYRWSFGNRPIELPDQGTLTDTSLTPDQNDLPAGQVDSGEESIQRL